MPSGRGEVTDLSTSHQACRSSGEKNAANTASGGAAISTTQSNAAGSGEVVRLIGRSMTRARPCNRLRGPRTLFELSRTRRLAPMTRTITITVTTRKRELDSARGWLVYAS
ncbi:hypothetical protein TBR22_A46840 [Luteitalea sp. TBR-22]|nr:hypothetical protein TBR22_A46840 [Luteitalea sp. TBR-22]